MSSFWFIDRLETFSDKEAIVFEGKSFSYRDVINNYRNWKDKLTG
jgi:hypothetical protein